MEQATPVLRIADANRALDGIGDWGYDHEWEHRFEPGFPTIVSISRSGEAKIFLSEHAGDAMPNGLVYLMVREIEPIATEFEAEIVEQPWGREVHLTDPDGNRLRVGVSAQAG